MACGGFATLEPVFGLRTHKPSGNEAIARTTPLICTAGTRVAPHILGISCLIGFPRGLFMVVENRLRENDDQPATPSRPDAYEVYWRSAEDDRHARLPNRSSASSDSWDCLGTGDAYSELWQLWDAQ
jgi:hypothetical protein